MTDFEGRAALVTGGGKGIGQATALGFARAGAAVTVIDQDDVAGKRTAADIEAAGGQALFIAADVTDASQVEAAVAAAVDRWGRLDFAHNNAGITGAGAFTADYSEQEWDRVLAINLKSVFLCMKYELPHLIRQGGAIVNTSSGAGLVGFAGLPAYVASKHGVIGLTKAAALEYAAAGVRINAICPGSTRTPMLEGFMGDDPKMEKMMAAGSPLRRLATPEEIAAAVVWLCSDEASFVLGVAFPVDGGAVAQ
jgi:NAD(P)-dependent dehydrogenase (short-subunit alcohol dehydrogenase family)